MKTLKNTIKKIFRLKPANQAKNNADFKCQNNRSYIILYVTSQTSREDYYIIHEIPDGNKINFDFVY